MTRPRFTPSALLATGLLWLAYAPAEAAPITATAYYSLTADEGLAPPPLGDIDAPQVVALVSPAGGVVPPTAADGSQGSPLTILPDSHGFDADQLVVALKDASSDSGAPEQYLGLIFFGKGLEAGGVLNFALSIDGALANDPPKLASSTPGIRIASLPAPGGDPGNPSGGPGDDPGAPNVPEPIGFLLWSAAAGAIAMRGRARVRAAAGR